MLCKALSHSASEAFGLAEIYKHSVSDVPRRIGVRKRFTYLSASAQNMSKEKSESQGESGRYLVWNSAVISRPCVGRVENHMRGYLYESDVRSCAT
jgi:hypothetical protein